MKLNLKLRAQDAWQRGSPARLRALIESAQSKYTAIPHHTGTLDSTSAPACCATQTKYTLRPYQVEGVKYLRQHRRRFLSDKPGLGKTLQAAYAAVTPTLIACPTYLTQQWYDLLQECGCNAVIAAGDRRSRQGTINQCADFTIVNVEMLRRKGRDKADATQAAREAYTFPHWYRTLIVDEAHHLRGRNSLQSMGALDVAKRTPYVYLLTGTPVYNKPDDLFAQLRLLAPDVFTSYYQFLEAYCKVLDTGFGLDVRGAQPELRGLFEKYSLGRTYEDVGIQLPDLIKSTLRLDADVGWRAKYDRAKLDYRRPDGNYADSALEILHTLRRYTATPKLQALLQIMRDTDALQGSVIFCKYKDTARALSALLYIPCITGDNPAADRVYIAQSDTCMVATLDSLKEGANLGHLHTVVFFEMDYVPGAVYQALMRVRGRRVGGSVRAYYLLVRNTIDEVIYNVDSRRGTTINAVVRKCLE